MKTIGTGIVEGLSTRADGSVVIKIATQELDSTDAARIFELRNKYVKYIFSDSNISEADEKLIDDLHLKDGRKIKSPAQRLRSVLFKVYELEGSAPEQFDQWYKEKMEELISFFKKKLE
jgi:hypothetical protein